MLLLSEILPHIQGTYKSIEIGIACAYYQDKWVNLYTNVIFSYDTPKQLSKAISENEKLSQLKNGQKFRIHKKIIPYKELTNLCNSFCKGLLESDGIIINYDLTDMMNFDLFFSRQQSTDDGWGRYLTFASRKQGSSNPSNEFLESLRSDVIDYGYEDIDESIKSLVDKERRTDNAMNFAIRVPLFAKIEKIDLENGKMTITVKHHETMDGLVLHYKKYRPENGASLRDSQIETGPGSFNQTKGTATHQNNITTWKVDVEEISPTGNSYQNDYREVALFFKPLSLKVSDMTKSIDALMAEKHLLANNPLAKIFVKFCSVDNLEKILVTPASVDNYGSFKLGSSDNFERAVYWMFTMYGFQTMWLGKDFEELKDERNVVEGSTDLICYNEQEKSLVLVSCKTAEITDTHISSIRNLASRLETEIKELGLKMVPVIVSAKPADANKAKGAQFGVKILDVNDMKKIISEIDKRPRPDLLLNLPYSGLGYNT